VKEYTNRLINEKSPYLLQHAHNPVDWYPWGDEAFEKAKAEDKPVFLSIGYSTCHWCHVMERESFEDREVADILNQFFVSIKVDREERPDVDHFYMDACTALNGQGGWPLSCFLTPDRIPFFAGTYFPKKSRYSMPGFMEILTQISDLWKNRRDQITNAGASLVKESTRNHRSKRKSSPGADSITNAYRQLSMSFDSEYGGFGGAPKFPSLQNILFLLRYGAVYQRDDALKMAERTLRGMAAGGIRDHIGGGFCRYSTDRKWLAPHFEKMTYDNVLHLIAYTEASVVLNPDFAEIAEETAEFLKREMAGPYGGFCTALDADSEGVEGKFYLFAPEDIRTALGDRAEKFCNLYDISGDGNFEGKSIPNLIGRPMPENEKNFAAGCRADLLTFREKRIPPLKDDKVLAANNGLAAAAFAIAGRVLKKPDYIKLSEQCAGFLLKNLTRSGRLLARWRDHHADHPSTFDDYAYLVWGLIELYEATFEQSWLELALKWTKKSITLFWDEDGGFYLTGSDVEDLPVRQKSSHDGAIPSGNSVAAMNLIRLARLTGKSSYEQMAVSLIESFGEEIESYPSAFTAMLCARMYLEHGGAEIILTNGEEFDELLKKLPLFSPFTVTAVCGLGHEGLADLAPFMREMKNIDGKAAAYCCKNGACSKPVTDSRAFQKLLEDL
ncbi:MAG TPA: thioredoxin domain-containing protein, partial [Clostridia bacterium]|nr:thioredoxin domain-containing protein [Clostridia bacterium]